MNEDIRNELQQMFDRLEKKVLSIVTIALTSIGVIVVVLGILLASIYTTTGEIETRQYKQEMSIENIKRDFGDGNQVLHRLYPGEIVFENNYINYVLKRGGIR